MSTADPPRAPAGPAPWRQLFLEHISKVESPEFVFSTLSRATDSTTGYVPRARYCIYRGMFGSIPYSKHYDTATYGKNASRYESDMLTLSTDARMEKSTQIYGEEDNDTSTTGGGAAVEAVFWIKDTMTQWRFKGQAYLLGPDIDNDNIQRVHQTKRILLANMRIVNASPWSWSQEIHSHFGNLSPSMRGYFQSPAPGTAVVGQQRQASNGIEVASVPIPTPGQKITTSLNDAQNAIAKANFRVVVICVQEVDQLDVGLSRRWRWRLRSCERRGGGERGEEGGDGRNGCESEDECEIDGGGVDDVVVGGDSSTAPSTDVGDPREWFVEELWP